jgi:Domain of unknown function (DUF4913)
MTDPESERLTAGELARVRRAMAIAAQASSRRPVTSPASLEPRFENLVAWVAGYFAPTFGRLARSSAASAWCARWWDHPEAVLRLDALWCTWEVAAAAEGGDLSEWIRLNLDPNLAALASPDGPFAACTAEHHTPDVPLPSEAPPKQWWSADSNGGQG